MILAVAVVVAVLCPSRCLVNGLSLDGEGGGSGGQVAVLGLLQPCAQVSGHYLDAQKQPCHVLLDIQ